MEADRPQQRLEDSDKLALHGLKTADYVRVESLLSLEQKSSLAARLAGAVNTNGATAADTADAEAILRLIIWNGEPRVLQCMAEAAAGNPNAPRDLAWALANDDEAVAIPILEVSTVLSDADLTAIVETSENFTKMGAIARRAAVSAGVSRSLAQHGDETTVHLLLKNRTAEIPDDAYTSMLDRHGGREFIQEGIIDRGTIAPSIRERLSGMVGAKLADKLAQGNSPSAPRPTRTVGYKDDLSPEDLTEIIAEMVAEKSITASSLVRKLCAGNFDFFCRSLGAMTKTPHDDVCSRLLESPAAHLPPLWERAALAAGWLPIGIAATAALIHIDENYSKADAALFRRNIVDRTLATLKAEKVDLNDAQKSFFRAL